MKVHSYFRSLSGLYVVHLSVDLTVNHYRLTDLVINDQNPVMASNM